LPALASKCAFRRIGELSRELDKAPQASGGRHASAGKPTKTAALKAAGISTSAAHRCEKLAAIPAATSCQRWDSFGVTEKDSNVEFFFPRPGPWCGAASASIAPALRSARISQPFSRRLTMCAFKPFDGCVAAIARIRRVWTHRAGVTAAELVSPLTGRTLIGDITRVNCTIKAR